MSTIPRIRRVVATGIHRVLLVVGVAGLVYVPVAFATGGHTAAVPVLLLAILMIASSVGLARSLDIQRTVRRMTTRQAEAPVSVTAAAPPIGQSRLPSPRGREVTSGRILAGAGADQLPVIGFAMIDMSEDDVRRTIAELAEHQLLSASFKPLLILDQPVFGAARAFGYPAELIIPAGHWQGSQADRANYLQGRLDSLRDSYGCAGVVRIPASGLGDFGRAQVDSLAAEWARRHKISLPSTEVARRRPVAIIAASSLSSALPAAAVSPNEPPPIPRGRPASTTSAR